MQKEQKKWNALRIFGIYRNQGINRYICLKEVENSTQESDFLNFATEPESLTLVTTKIVRELYNWPIIQ
jgi:hypothetical protein